MFTPNVPFVGILPHLCLQKPDPFIRLLQIIPIPDSNTITSNEVMARIASLDQDSSVSVVVTACVTVRSQQTRKCKVNIEQEAA
jgi:hypothetical protein